MKKTILILSIALYLIGCGENNNVVPTPTAPKPITDTVPKIDSTTIEFSTTDSCWRYIVLYTVYYDLWGNFLHPKQTKTLTPEDEMSVIDNKDKDYCYDTIDYYRRDCIYSTRNAERAPRPLKLTNKNDSIVKLEWDNYMVKLTAKPVYTSKHVYIWIYSQLNILSFYYVYTLEKPKWAGATNNKPFMAVYDKEPKIPQIPLLKLNK